MRDQMAKLHDRWLAYSLQETFFLSRLRLCWYLRAFYEREVKYTEQIPSPLNVWIARNKTKTISLHCRSESDVSKIHLAHICGVPTSLWGAFKYSAFKGVDISASIVSNYQLLVEWPILIGFPPHIDICQQWQNRQIQLVLSHHSSKEIYWQI